MGSENIITIFVYIYSQFFILGSENIYLGSKTEGWDLRIEIGIILGMFLGSEKRSWDLKKGNGIWNIIYKLK